MESTDPLSVRTLTFCTITFAQSFTVLSITLCRKRFCPVAYIRGTICVPAHTRRTTTSAAGQQHHRRRMALWRGPAYKTEGDHFRAKEKRRSRDGLSCHYMTRELIANTLGVRRAGITGAGGSGVYRPPRETPGITANMKRKGHAPLSWDLSPESACRFLAERDLISPSTPPSRIVWAKVDR